mmetsp:Transcript_1026/g.1015  ORF Transcript_1026/g.1015 Transcript_1026/m.1015 type:complete len:93 (+) Transcript_1026:208-486(+)
MFCKLAKLSKNQDSESMVQRFAHYKSQQQLQTMMGTPMEVRKMQLANMGNQSTLSLLDTLIKENRVKKWNHQRINIYEIICGMAIIGYGNYP